MGCYTIMQEAVDTLASQIPNKFESNQSTKRFKYSKFLTLGLHQFAFQPFMTLQIYPATL